MKQKRSKIYDLSAIEKLSYVGPSLKEGYEFAHLICSKLQEDTPEINELFEEIVSEMTEKSTIFSGERSSIFSNAATSIREILDQKNASHSAKITIKQELAVAIQDLEKKITQLEPKSGERDSFVESRESNHSNSTSSTISEEGVTWSEKVSMRRIPAKQEAKSYTSSSTESYDEGDLEEWEEDLTPEKSVSSASIAGTLQLGKKNPVERS